MTDRGNAAPFARYPVRIGLTLFAVLCVVNAFFNWSFPAWFGIFGPPMGLVSPGVDKWVITPLAMAVYFLQFPSYAVLYNVKALANAGAPSSVILASFFSMPVYLPLTLWIRSHRMRRKAA